LTFEADETMPDNRRSSVALDMDNFVPGHLTYLVHKISASASALYRPRFGVGITHWRIMALLGEKPWTTPGAICDATGLDKGAVSRTLHDLVEAGLAEVQEGKANQRRLPAALTAKGLEMHDKMVELATAREQQLLADFSAEERQQLLGFLVRMRERLETAP
jgi:DNA-binding MarR family transcriptional regulator